MRCIFCVETSPLDTIDEAVILQIKELHEIIISIHSLLKPLNPFYIKKYFFLYFQNNPNFTILGEI